MKASLRFIDSGDMPLKPRALLSAAEAISLLPPGERLLIRFELAYGYVGRQATRAEVMARISSRPAYRPGGTVHALLPEAVLEFVDDDACAAWVCSDEPGAGLASAWSNNPEQGEMLNRVN